MVAVCAETLNFQKVEITVAISPETKRRFQQYCIVVQGWVNLA